VLLEPGVDFAAAKAKDVRAEPEAGKLAGSPAAKNARSREAEELGDFACGEKAVAHINGSRETY